MVHMINDGQDHPIREMVIKIRLSLMLGNPRALKDVACFISCILMCDFC